MENLKGMYMLELVRRIVRSKMLRLRHSEFSSQVPVGVERWLAFVSSSEKDSLLPVRFRQGESGYQGVHDELKAVFVGQELGTWAIDSKTIDFIWDRLDKKRPDTIVEFGSGCSTCVFASWMKKKNPNGIIVSIDQNEWAAQETQGRLRAFDLQSFVKMINMKQDANDRYEVDLDRLGDALSGREINLVFSDGPAGVDGCRDNTLTSVIPLLADDAVWFLHDALRDGELEICRAWGTIKGISVEGIVPFGNGLAVGTWSKSPTIEQAGCCRQ